MNTPGKVLPRQKCFSRLNVSRKNPRFTPVNWKRSHCHRKMKMKRENEPMIFSDDENWDLDDGPITSEGNLSSLRATEAT
jgi:hypothetical protein